MASPFDGIDLDDPCAVWPVLRKAYLELLAGRRVSRVRIGVDDVTFSAGDLNAVERTMNALKAECEARTSGVTHRRRAFSAGFR